MQRYSGGLAVPKNMVETFSGKTSDNFGVVVCGLQYTPMSLDHVVVSDGEDVASSSLRKYKKISIVGCTLEFYVKKLEYLEASVITGGSAGGGTGADPHTHAVSRTWEELGYTTQSLEPQSPITIYYKVA